MDPTMGEPLVVRPIAPADAAAAARLSSELGYPVGTDAMRERLAMLAALPEHGVFVACRGDVVLGWIHVAAVVHLQSEPRAEIGGLVVTSASRSQRVGARLLAAAELWARDRGVSTIVVRSQIKREDAHRFYLREGYERTKTSAVFTKSVGGPAPGAAS